jgi:hypothetical protein
MYITCKTSKLHKSGRRPSKLEIWFGIALDCPILYHILDTLLLSFLLCAIRTALVPYQGDHASTQINQFSHVKLNVAHRLNVLSRIPKISLLR